MILSFHPMIVGDVNRLCAGREPDARDAEAVRSARAVILPQGCGLSLYRLARTHCRHVFPDYEARFAFQGKLGQIRLFESKGACHPASFCFENVAAFSQTPLHSLPFGYPMVFKFDWGGEGRTVFPVPSPSHLAERLEMARRFEATGQSGFLLQQHIPAGGRSLRVVVIGSFFSAYWRVSREADGFYGNLASGGRIDRSADPHLREKAIDAVKALCRQTGINLAGFDLLFSVKELDPSPIFLEINYFFGREGLGGSEGFYRLLEAAVDRWLERIGCRPPGKTKAECVKT